MRLEKKYRPGTAALAEMAEFGSFTSATQRYIRRSLDVGLDRRDAVRRWSRDPHETARIRLQEKIYRRIDPIRSELSGQAGTMPDEAVFAALVAVTAFDLREAKLPNFAAYRFLYERLIGACVRPWLPAAFAAAATLPHLHPEHRRELIRGLDEAATLCAAWSKREPIFIPIWVDKTDPALSA
ncbi:MAG: hypothetical protein ABWX67_06980 [Allosphingosinicella sp.]